MALKITNREVDGVTVVTLDGRIVSNLGSHSNQLLQMTKLLTVFEVSNTEADAVRSFSN